MLLARAVKLVLPPLVGLAFVVLVWQLIATRNEAFPSPLATMHEALAQDARHTEHRKTVHEFLYRKQAHPAADAA